jgi:hypothetical protein
LPAITGSATVAAARTNAQLYSRDGLGFARDSNLLDKNGIIVLGALAKGKIVKVGNRLDAN